MNPLGIITTDSNLIEKVKSLADYPLEELTTKYAEKYKLDPLTAKEHEQLFLRFLSLSFITSESTAPTDYIDNYWHHFILWTRAYTDFCVKIFGNYIHHCPAHSPNKDPDLQKAGHLTESLFSEYYGAETEKSITNPYKCNKICLLRP